MQISKFEDESPPTPESFNELSSEDESVSPWSPPKPTPFNEKPGVQDVLDRMIQDTNRRYSNEVRITQLSCSSSKKPKTQVFDRMIDDIARRNMAQKLISDYKKQKEEEEVSQFKHSKKVSKKDSEATFKRLINDAKQRKELQNYRQKVKELEMTRESESVTSTAKISKERESNLVSRLLEFEKKRLEKIQKQQKFKELEITQIETERQKRHPKRKLDLTVFERLTSPPKKPTQPPVPKKLFSRREAAASGQRLMNFTAYSSPNRLKRSQETTSVSSARSLKKHVSQKVNQLALNLSLKNFKREPIKLRSERYVGSAKRPEQTSPAKKFSSPESLRVPSVLETYDYISNYL